MNRFVLLFGVVSCLGCQSADPLAVFGPYKVPPPSTAEVSPYYPPGAPTAQQPADKTTSPRVSVSVETPLPPTSAARLATDPADRQPIRVVENPSGSTRTASANRSGSTSVDANSPVPSTATAK